MNIQKIVAHCRSISFGADAINEMDLCNIKYLVLFCWNYSVYFHNIVFSEEAFSTIFFSLGWYFLDINKQCIKNSLLQNFVSSVRNRKLKDNYFKRH